MKNITLSADEDLVEKARSIARSQRRTLNAAFREWLVEFTACGGTAQDYQVFATPTASTRANPCVFDTYAFVEFFSERLRSLSG